MLIEVSDRNWKWGDFLRRVEFAEALTFVEVRDEALVGKQRIEACHSGELALYDSRQLPQYAHEVSCDTY